MNRSKEKSKLTDPTAHTIYHQFPFVCISHDDFPAFPVVGGNSHFGHIVRTTDIQCLIDFVFDRQTMTIPTEPTFHMIALLMRIPGDHIFNGSSQNVAVMRQSSCKRRSIVERIAASRETTTTKKTEIIANEAKNKLKKTSNRTHLGFPFDCCKHCSKTLFSDQYFSVFSSSSEKLIFSGTR